ncbi:MAG: hypothetical protein NVS9B15_09350 [Acidobacteriaceae bacterium]
MISGTGSPHLEAASADANGPHLATMLSAHALLRIASGANGILIGLYLGHRDNAGAANNVRLVGILSAVSFASELVGSIPLGMASDAFNPRWLMTGGALAGALAALLFAFTGSSTIFLVSRTLEGLAAAAIVPALLAYLTSNTEGNNALRARVMSYFELSLLAGLAFGGLAASQLFRVLHAHAFAVIALGYGACGLLLFAGARGHVHYHVEDPLSGLRTAWRLPGLRHLAPVWLSVNAVIGLWLGPTLPFLLTRHSANGQYLAGIFADEPGKVGTMLLGYSVVFGLGVLGWSFVLPRIRVRHAMTITLGAILPVCIGFYIFNHLPAPAMHTRWLVAAFIAIGIMVESGFTPAALAWLAGTLPPTAGRGAAMGIYSVLLSLGAILGSLLAGFLGERYSVDGLLYGTVLVAVAAMIFLHWVPEQQKRMETA